ncbi:aldehyde dehydrogenase family protein, partial [Acinetobacter baumannii]
MSEVQILESVQQFMARQHGNFIDGKLVAAELLDKVDIVNPSTEQVVAQISIGSQQDVESAVKSAEHAFQNAWAETTPYER